MVSIRQKRNSEKRSMTITHELEEEMLFCATKHPENSTRRIMAVDINMVSVFKIKLNRYGFFSN